MLAQIESNAQWRCWDSILFYYGATAKWQSHPSLSSWSRLRESTHNELIVARTINVTFLLMHVYYVEHGACTAVSSTFAAMVSVTIWGCANIHWSRRALASPFNLRMISAFIDWKWRLYVRAIILTVCCVLCVVWVLLKIVCVCVCVPRCMGACVLAHLADHRDWVLFKGTQLLHAQNSGNLAHALEVLGNDGWWCLR